MSIGYRVDDRDFQVGDDIGKRPMASAQGLPPGQKETERLLALSPQARCDRGEHLFVFTRTREALVLWLEIPAAAIYLVEFSPDCVLHTGDMDLVDQMNGTDDATERAALAQAYWTGEPPLQAPEVIVEGTVRVLGRWGPDRTRNEELLGAILRSRAEGRLALSPPLNALLEDFGLVLGMDDSGAVFCEQVTEPHRDLFSRDQGRVGDSAGGGVR